MTKVIMPHLPAKHTPQEGETLWKCLELQDQAKRYAKKEWERIGLSR